MLDVTGGEYPELGRGTVYQTTVPSYRSNACATCIGFSSCFTPRRTRALEYPQSAVNPVYASGYSMGALRGVEVRAGLRTPAEKNGAYLWDSLQRTLTMLYDGTGTALRLPAG